MKNTLIALMGLSSSLYAASISAGDLSAWVVLNENDSLTLGGMSCNIDTVDGKYIFTANENVAFAAATNGNRTATTIAITLNFDNIETFPDSDSPLLCIDGVSADAGMGYNATSGVLTGSWNTTYSYYEAKQINNLTGTHTFVFTMGDSGTRIYVDNSTAYWSKSNLKGSLGNINDIELSAWVSEGLEKMTIYSGIDCYNDTALAASVFKTHQALVPEPTTATLSLLALAGLAARRRRK